MTNFSFLDAEAPTFVATARKAETYAHTDPETSAFYGRKALEQLVRWQYANDLRLTDAFPVGEQVNLNDLLRPTAFKGLFSKELVDQLHVLKKAGNQAAHDGSAAFDSVSAVSLVKVLFGYAVAVGRLFVEPDDLPAAFDPADLLPVLQPQPLSATERAELEKAKTELAQKQVIVAQTEQLLTAKEAELAAMRTTLEARNAPVRTYTGVLTEAETRQLFIDQLLREAGWYRATAGGSRAGLYTVEERINPADIADYVLWGADGLPLAVIEAKRTTRSADEGKDQAKRYADALEKRYGRRPVIYYSNGYTTYCWDDLRYPPRTVQGIHRPDELTRMVARRTGALPFGNNDVNTQIASCPFQKKAISAVGERFGEAHRKALLVMATGSGKTRTAIALVDAMMSRGWVKRVLFLADRRALVKQAYTNFKIHKPNLTGVNLLDDNELGAGQVVFSTYQTVINRIDSGWKNGERELSIGYFDLVIIDEAHRSIYKKYGAIFDYFDSLLVGLTATPKDETDRDTFNFFDLPQHEPTFNFPLAEAVAKKYLVPYRGVTVPLKFMSSGIRYDDLPDAEKAHYEDTFDDGSGLMPDAVEADDLNKWLFNQDTVDRVLEHLMARGLKVEGGDRLGKTIIFARNHDHADYIVERFNILFPANRGHFCQFIDYSVNDADRLIDAFSEKDKTEFQIAVSVDMLDTGIDIPEVVNLVFFKRVLSKAKFWQMIGRGTRLRPNLFGPGDDKAFFYIFDYCENFIFFGQNPADVDPPLAASLSQQVFSTRLRLAMALPNDGDANLMQFRADLFALLIGQVQGLDSDSFLVRRKAEVIDRYHDPARWTALNDTDLAALHIQIAPLMLEKNTHESARRFDKLLIDSQLAFAMGQATRLATLSEKGQQLAKGLQKKGSIPAVAQEMALIQQVAGSRFWSTTDVTGLETVRLRLRHLVHHIDKEARKPLYTNLTDEIIGPELTHEPLLAYANSEAYIERMERILRHNVNHLTVRKLHMNQPITEHELNELERLLFADSLPEAKAQFEAALGQKPLGIFVRSLVGLDHDAATAAFSEFMENGPLSPAQADFIQYLISYLTENGSIVDKAELFKPPFTNYDSNGVHGVFGERAPRLIQLIDTVNGNAQASA